MKVVTQLETTFKQWHEKSPVHLPDGLRNWLATNAWWLVIVGIVLSVIGVISLLNTLLWAEQILGDYIRAFAPHIGAGYTIGSWISIATIIVTVALYARAVQPLRQLNKSGWNLLFIAFLVDLAGSALSGIVQGDIATTIIGLAIGGLIGGFVLFEVRSQFAGKPAASKTTETPPIDTSKSTTKVPTED